MASSSNTCNPLFGIQITEKLSKSNHALWQAQVLTAIRGACLEGYITGKTGVPEAEVNGNLVDGKIAKVLNPAYNKWFARDQQVLGFLFTSVTKTSLCRSSL